MCWKSRPQHGQHVFSGRRQGFLLLEMLAAVFLLALSAVWILPAVSDWQREQRLDMAAGQITSLIRTVQVEAKSGDLAYPGGSGIFKEITFSSQGAGRRVRYYCVRTGIYTMGPKGWLPEGVRITPGTVSIRFAQNGYPSGSDYSFRLRDTSGKGVRKIVVEAYTGRVRVERES